jgi:histidinol phosphatase-like enzyme (inositol monophosphatase family)
MDLTEAKLHELEQFGLRLCALASSVSLPLFRSKDLTVSNKELARFDPVTEADRACETIMRQAIRAAYPDHGIIGEEWGSEQIEADFVWVLDPIDGTRAFVCGLPVWTSLIGLRYKQKQMMGFIAQPVLAEVYLGSPLGSRLITPMMQTPLTVRSPVKLSEALLSTTDPYLFYGGDAACFESLRKAVKLARFGADAYAFALVASGQIDLAMDSGLKPWDIDAIIPVISNAGGIVCDWQGGTIGLNGGNVVAGSHPSLVKEAIAHLAHSLV